MIKKILITGGLGFIGSNLAKACVVSGYDVTLISRTDKKIANIHGFRDKITLCIKDIKDIGEEVRHKDYIFHFAGTTDNYNILDNPYLDIEANCNGTIALLEACRKYNPQARIVYGSSFFVNGNQEKLPVGPSSPCEPLGLYGATKLAGEHFCKIYNAVFGMDSVIIRFTNIFGVGEQPRNKKKAGFNYLISSAIDGEEIPLYSNGNFYRDYMYIDDAVSAALVVSEKGKKGSVYYAGRGEFVKFKKLIDIVAREVGGVKIKPVEPPDFHKSVGIVDFVCDNSALKKLGWKPRVSLKEGIRRTIERHKKDGSA